MSQKLIGASPDLKHLRNDGFEIEVKGGYLLIHQIPYVNNAREIKRGSLVCKLDLVHNNLTAKPSTHVMFFVGEYPCYNDGSAIEGIRNSTQTEDFGNGIIVNHTFSNKPPNGYADFYEKVVRYADIISVPAKSLDPTLTEKTFRVIEDTEEDSVFHYLDTNSSRANIDAVNEKLKGQKIGIIGMGGTGAYILDQIAKTPVLEIHIYDGDDFLLHNAFRSPGAASMQELEKHFKKTEYYSEKYSEMHKYIYSHPYYVNSLNIEELKLFNFVFICIDKDDIKKEFIEYLVVNRIPFIDVGLGVSIVNNSLIGSIRVTTGTPEKNDHLLSCISCGDDSGNEYGTNIQIADLNALNAIMAVIKWKKLLGFYYDSKLEHQQVYTLDFSLLLNDELTS